jgi:hypothetical protein
MLRLYLFYRAYVIFFVYFILNSAALAVTYFMPLIIVTGDNPTVIRYLDVPLGLIAMISIAVLLLIGSRSYLKRNRRISRVFYDVSLLFLLSQISTIVFRYVSLQQEIANNPYSDNINVSFGGYIYIMVGLVIIGLLFRLIYVGVERRNSVYIVR